MGTPHKHAEVIKAWADGATIEFRCPIGDGAWSDWQTLKSGSPTWDIRSEYRVKEELYTITLTEEQRRQLLATVIHFMPLSMSYRKAMLDLLNKAKPNP